MKQQLRLNFLFPTLNDYTKALKKHRLIGQDMKTQYTLDVNLMAKSQKIKPFDGPVTLSFLYIEKNEKRDPDNIVAFAKKCILDGLVNARVITDDNQKYIKRFTDEWIVDSKKPGVLVIIEEWNDDRRVNPLDNNSTD